MSDKLEETIKALEYKKMAERNRQLIDDIEKADSDYFKMRENRDSWRKAFYKSFEEFKRLSGICDKLIIARNMLTEENDELKDSAQKLLKALETRERENKQLRNALESTEKELNDYQETCETLTKENERLKKLCKLCGSY